MVMRKKTLRRLSPVARKVARLAGEADSVGRRLKNLLAEIQSLELDSSALKNARAAGAIIQDTTPIEFPEPRHYEEDPRD